MNTLIGRFAKFLSTQLRICKTSAICTLSNGNIVPPLQKYRDIKEDSTVPHGKIYELRTYTFHPKNTKECLKITEESFHLRTNHSKLIGYWITELGGANEVVHVWEYDDYAHRRNVRKALAEDEEWQNKFLKKVSPMWMDQKNSIMMLLPWSQLILPSQPGVYEMQIFNMNSHAAIWNSRLKAAIELQTSFVEEHKSVMIGAFLTIFGYHNTVVIFWQHQNFDICSIGRLNLLSEANKAIMNGFYHEVGSAYSKGLIPHKVSPMQ